jgi:hypothetical protein
LRIRGWLASQPICWTLVLAAGITLYVSSVAPMYSAHPSKDAERYWEKSYASFLPPGYSDFGGHWQDQDIGVAIFSFRRPQGKSVEEALNFIGNHSAGFKRQAQRNGEVVLRRSVTYSDPAGFDEFRFVRGAGNDRIYAMFANLDSEMEALHKLVEKLREVSRGSQ